MAVVSSLQDNEYDDLDVGFHPHNLSSLSMCTSSLYTNDGDDYDDHHHHLIGISNDMSRLSIESFDADVDEDFFSKKFLELSSDSDQEPSCYSLPASPPRRRNRTGMLMVVKDYASENEAQKGGLGRPKRRSVRSKNPRERRVTRERWAELSAGKSESKRKDGGNNHSGSFSGESEGGAVVVITRPKGGNRSLCMDLGEVKACRDLGFELEHERMFEMPGRVSLSGSNFEKYQ
ncbi:uncharacterized protein LOC120207150 [Hibiscus syriacus]|uniref:uncharacterized protein LOC120207150 n=1 Tax=Hibiscus syriacus TaxID=106335 RepID=UPI0019224555|nr:uncharacterized protein LOC120207150 [Hibiscus syriacus]